jgi:Icc protein
MLKVIQCSDTHLLPDPNGTLRGCSPWFSLQILLLEVKRHTPDLLLLSGDLADAGSPLAYQNLVNLIEPLHIPTAWVPGNHDHLETMLAFLSQPPFIPILSTGILLKGWQILGLNSVLLEDPIGRGILTPNSLSDLKQTLMTVPEPTLLMLHHHPVATGIDWIDQMQVQNALEFRSLLHSYSTVKIVAFGHVHLALDTQEGSIGFHSCPSTCTQVIPPNSSPTDHYPGFRIFFLSPDGSYTTQVLRTKA